MDCILSKGGQEDERGVCSHAACCEGRGDQGLEDGGLVPGSGVYPGSNDPKAFGVDASVWLAGRDMRSPSMKTGHGMKT